MTFPYNIKLIAPSDPRLWEPSIKVTNPLVQVLPYLFDMKKLMQEKKGIGLAAPQVGLNYNFFLMGPLVIINPHMVSHRSPLVDEMEGCLTWPNMKINVKRFSMVEMRWTDEKGDVHQRQLTGFVGRVAQHEFDHLHGRCIFPRFPPPPMVLPLPHGEMTYDQIRSHR